MYELITVRRCRGNRDAWAAVIGPNDWLITTALSLDRLVASARARYPESRIVIEQDQ